MPNFDMSKLERYLDIHDLKLETISAEGFKVKICVDRYKMGSNPTHNMSDYDFQVGELQYPENLQLAYLNAGAIAEAQQVVDKETGAKTYKLLNEANLGWFLKDYCFTGKFRIPAKFIANRLEHLYAFLLSTDIRRMCETLSVDRRKFYRWKYLSSKTVEEVETGLSGDTFKSFMEDAYAKQLEIAQSILRSYTTLVWKKIDPQSQTYGSFNPIIKNPSDWYGKFYTETPVRLTKPVEFKNQDPKPLSVVDPLPDDFEQDPQEYEGWDEEDDDKDSDSDSDQDKSKTSASKRKSKQLDEKLKKRKY
jgi:hypothetical protein